MEIAYGAFLLGATVWAVVVNKAFDLKLGSYWSRILLAIVVVSLPFIAWDAYATHFVHWSFNPDYILSFKIGNLPIEEVLFFVVIPIVMLVVRLLIARRPDKTVSPPVILFRFVAVILILLSFLFIDRSYAFVVFLLGGLFLLFLSLTNVIYSYHFWLFQFWLFFLFFVCNTYLTAVPIVEYSDQVITGMRIGSIPIEDFVYNFVLINSFVLIATKQLKLKH